MTESSKMAGIGHNNPPLIDPAVLTECEVWVNDFADAAGEWLNIKEITEEAQAEKLVDFISGARGVYKKIDNARKTAKQPHLDAGREVDATFKKMLAIIEKAINKMKPVQSAYLNIKAAEQREKAQEDARVAAEKQEAANKLAREAEARNDVVGMADADEATKDANKAAAAAERLKSAPVNVASATGGGRTMSQRITRSARITNISLLFIHYREHPDVVAVLQRLADADVRAKDVDHTKIQGIEEMQTRSAA